MIKNKWFICILLFVLIVGCEDKNEDIQNEGGLIDGIYTIYAGNMYYNPSNISITEGDSIRFINDNGFHDVKITSGPIKLFLNPCQGECTIGTLVFDVAGTYDYICSIGTHAQQGMIGTIIVNSKKN